MKVLVTDGDMAYTLGIVRSLGQKGVEVYCLGSSWHDVCFYSKFCNGKIIGPSSLDQEDYITFLEQTLSQYSFDLIIPVSYPSTYIIARSRQRIEPYTRIEIASYDSIDISVDKKRTYELAGKVGVPYPATFYPRSLDEVKEISEIIHYPVVVKSIFENNTKRIIFPKDREDLIKKYSSILSREDAITGQMPMIQEYVNGVTYSFGALYQKGKCKRIFMFKEIRSAPVTGGSASYAESFYDPVLKDYGMKMLDALHWNGVAHVEFKLDSATGELKLMEVNGKFWASLDVAVVSGVDFPWYLCQMASGEDLEYSETYDRKIRYHFPFSREILHLIQRPAAILRIVLDAINPEVKSDVWFTDLKPNIIDLGITIWSIILQFIPRGVRKAIRRLRKPLK